eukprot:s270_g30.t1
MVIYFLTANDLLVIVMAPALNLVVKIFKALKILQVLQPLAALKSFQISSPRWKEHRDVATEPIEGSLVLLVEPVLLFKEGLGFALSEVFLVSCKGLSPALPDALLLLPLPLLDVFLCVPEWFVLDVLMWDIDNLANATSLVVLSGLLYQDRPPELQKPENDCDLKDSHRSCDCYGGDVELWRAKVHELASRSVGVLELVNFVQKLEEPSVALGDIYDFAWQKWHLVTFALLLCGRRGIRRHLLHFVWQAWHLVTSAFLLRGRRGTYGTRLALVAALVTVDPWPLLAPRLWQVWRAW